MAETLYLVRLHYNDHESEVLGIGTSPRSAQKIAMAWVRWFEEADSAMLI